MKLVSKILMTLGVLAGSFVMFGSFTFEQANTLDAPPKLFALVLGLGTIAAIYVIWRKRTNTEEENSTDY
ncbi:hypothetical protein LB467_04490 [Salegentibacter sp. JZCK2]|uniref:hypothetical protein n=1 Tax=Salegentibacter tibetensis TaxID=2873600 RepID=UPI001CCF83A2|nr:hypothetical protein [Salegentibacter tibetensis]MBZ9728936.1 hypothetical protein [Salegentibacter tibetensis]